MSENEFEKIYKQQHSQKREAILSVAAEIFNKNGFSKTSLSDVADRLGITKNALYYYVKSKTDLIYQCYQKALNHSEKVIGQADQEGATGIEKISIWLKYLLMPEQGAIAILSELHALPDEQRIDLAKRIQAVEDKLRSFIVLGIKDGTVRDCNPKIAQFWLISAPSWLPIWFNANNTDMTIGQVSDIFIDLSVNGLKK